MIIFFDRCENRIKIEYRGTHLPKVLTFTVAAKSRSADGWVCWALVHTGLWTAVDSPHILDLSTLEACRIFSFCCGFHDCGFLCSFILCCRFVLKTFSQFLSLIASVPDVKNTRRHVSLTEIVRDWTDFYERFNSKVRARVPVCNRFSNITLVRTAQNCKAVQFTAV